MKTLIVLACMEATALGFMLVSPQGDKSGLWILSAIVLVAALGMMWIIKGKNK